MPNEFDRELKIDSEGRIVPAGPLELKVGEEVTKIMLGLSRRTTTAPPRCARWYRMTSLRRGGGVRAATATMRGGFT